MQPSYSLNSKENMSVEGCLENSNKNTESEGDEDKGERDSLYVQQSKCKTNFCSFLLSGQFLYNCGTLTQTIPEHCPNLVNLTSHM